MSVYEDIDAALDGLDVPYYHGMPEFSAVDEPERYISYSVRDKPYFYSSSEPLANKVWVVLSVFTPWVDPALYEAVIMAMKTAGYIYQGGNDAGETTPYPCRKHRVMDFIKNYDAT